MPALMLADNVIGLAFVLDIMGGDILLTSSRILITPPSVVLPLEVSESEILIVLKLSGFFICENACPGMYRGVMVVGTRKLNRPWS